ncbi:Transmembrane protein 241 [Anabarilius grahami]|uniref:Transmembrane protein 241 n=1 Tax=Anabarilius grahami TaxID=495550 RepID=A0A3N0XI26_ANAGA|nr:Transmembrane protein 241 [Anabarilius grahami]
MLLGSSASLILYNPRFGPSGYTWASIHLFCVGDLSGALDFPLLTSYRFHTGCLGSAIFSFCLLLATVKLKNSLPQEHCGVCCFLAKVLASGLSLSTFNTVLSPVTLCCVILNYTGEALFLYSDKFN